MTWPRAAAKGARGKASLARKARDLAVREGLFPPGSPRPGDGVRRPGLPRAPRYPRRSHRPSRRSGGPARPAHQPSSSRAGERRDEALVIAGLRRPGRRSHRRPPADRRRRAGTCRRGRAKRAARRPCRRPPSSGATASRSGTPPTIRRRRCSTGWAATAVWRPSGPCCPASRPGCARCWSAGARRPPNTAAPAVSTFAEDRGNAYPGYARTALREEVLPAWEAALPGAVEAAARAAAVAAEMERLAEGLLAEAERRVVSSGGGARRRHGAPR